MDKFNRKREREILLRLAEAYPKDINEAAENKKPFFTLPSYKHEFFYLAGHNLIELNHAVVCGDIFIFSAKITSQGIDFIKDDGGISAILDTVTVKIHEESIKAIIAEKIISLDLD